MDRAAAERNLSGQLTLFDDRTIREPDGRRRLLRIGGRIIEYYFARRRRRTIGIVIDAHGLRVAAPAHARLNDVEAFMRRKERWIASKLAQRYSAPRTASLQGVDGEILPLAGEAVALNLRRGARGVELVERSIVISLPDPAQRAAVRELLMQWLKARTLETLAPRGAHYARLLGRPTPPISISRARTQWGVCTRHGAIRLSWRLAQLAPRLADYVVAHEVAHLVEMNHSIRFWKLLETLYPDWRIAREEIARAGALLPQP